jgi:hypothetical protein
MGQTMNSAGSFAVHRGIWTHELLADAAPFSRREAWPWLISEAAWKPHSRRVNGRKIDLQRGQIAASLRFLAGTWRWSEPRVRRFLHTLAAEGMLYTSNNRRRSDAASDAHYDAASDAGVSVITICNYDEYQPGGQRSDAATDAQTDAGVNEKRRNREKENNRNKNSPPTPKGESEKENRRKREAQSQSPAPAAEAFERFKAVFPKRQTPHPWTEGRKRFVGHVLRGADPEEIVAGATAFAAAAADKVGSNFIPMVTTWLNQERWREYAASVHPEQPRVFVPGPGMPSREEILADVRRRQAESASAASSDVLAESPGVRDEEPDGLVYYHEEE